MGKKRKEAVIRETTENAKPYKDMKSRWIVLLIGFVLCAVSLACAIVPILMLFVDGWAEWGAKSGFTLVQLSKILNGVAVGAGFVGIIFAVAGANTNKLFARLAFTFGVIGFMVGVVMLLLSLFAGAIFSIG